VLDWAVTLTPLVALGALLLLGYVGCDFDGTITSPEFLIVVNIPTALQVTRITYYYMAPAGEALTATYSNPPAARTVGPDSYYQQDCGHIVTGIWIVGCEVEASDNGVTRSSINNNMPADLRDVVPHPEADFVTTGTPSGGDFTVNYVGVVGR
jgi:hypothetical protein